MFCLMTIFEKGTTPTKRCLLLVEITARQVHLMSKLLLEIRISNLANSNNMGSFAWLFHLVLKLGVLAWGLQTIRLVWCRLCRVLQSSQFNQIGEREGINQMCKRLPKVTFYANTIDVLFCCRCWCCWRRIIKRHCTLIEQWPPSVIVGKLILFCFTHLSLSLSLFPSLWLSFVLIPEWRPVLAMSRGSHLHLFVSLVAVWIGWLSVLVSASCESLARKAHSVLT